MSSPTPHPSLNTLWPWEPPVPPFEWRLADFGPVKKQVLFDSRGRQIFRGSSAVLGRTIPKKGWKVGGGA